MWQLAYALAKSGRYSGWLAIEHELRWQGFSRARQLLDSESIREKLDRMGADSREQPEVDDPLDLGTAQFRAHFTL
jgi:hypothetical protein